MPPWRPYLDSKKKHLYTLVMPLYTHKFAASPQETFTVSWQVSGAGFVIPSLCLAALKPLFLSSLQLRPSYVPTAQLLAYSKSQIGTVTSSISSQRTKIFFRRHFLLYLVLVDLNILSDVLHPLLMRLSHSPTEFTASPRFVIIHSFHHFCFYDPK